MPYFTMTNSEAIEKIVQGYRLGQPEECSLDMYKLMLSCWEINPDQRPSFTRILEAINQLIGAKVAESMIVEVKETTSTENIYN